MTITDLNDAERAVRRGWDIKDHVLDELPHTAKTIISDPKASNRDKLAAGRLLATMHAQNLACATRMVERADARGIDNDLPQDSGPIEIIVEYVDDYYGSAAAAEGRLAIASPDGPPVGCPAAPSTYQDPGVRAEVG